MAGNKGRGITGRTFINHDSSPYNDVLSPKDSDDTRNTIDNKGLNVTGRTSANKDSSPKKENRYADTKF